MVEFIGLLKVKVIKGTNLAIRDMMSSDPYVILTLGQQVSHCFFFTFIFGETAYSTLVLLLVFEHTYYICVCGQIYTYVYIYVYMYIYMIAREVIGDMF